LIVVHEEAVREARAARRYYARKNAAMGARFLAEFERVLAAVAENPQRWPEHPSFKGYRSFRFRRFRTQ
jgi:plasmid stabilization system protein ParE